MDNHIVEMLMLLKNKANLTQAEIARQLDIGNGVLGDYINGKKFPGRGTRASIRNLFCRYFSPERGFVLLEVPPSNSSEASRAAANGVAAALAVARELPIPPPKPLTGATTYRKRPPKPGADGRSKGPHGPQGPTPIEPKGGKG